MKTETTIKSNIDDLSLHYYEEEEDIDLSIPFKIPEPEAAKKLECSETLIDTLCALVTSIRELLGSDLKDIWERLDKLERRIERLE